MSGAARSRTKSWPSLAPELLVEEDEILAVLHESSNNKVIESNGQALVLDPVLPRPPIYVGGNGKVAIPRAIKYGDGWMPVGQSPEELKPQIDDFNKRAEEAGRSGMEIVAMKTLPLEDMSAAKDLACAYQDAGATQLVHTQGYDSPTHYAEIVDQVDREVRIALR